MCSWQRWGMAFHSRGCERACVWTEGEVSSTVVAPNCEARGIRRPSWGFCSQAACVGGISLKSVHDISAADVRLSVCFWLSCLRGGKL